ncbi:MAG TPA: glycoside hydrolase family 18 protein [Chitinophagaceae bacterium]|nr:glycoside hydrolase family 18 protein [Chitinophagaceae bacterium]
MRYLALLLAVSTIVSCNHHDKGKSKIADFSVIAYYSGNATLVDSFPIEKLTHIIYSFCHLKGNRLNVDNADDTLTIEKLVSLKSRNPGLKILLSLGGWGGCRSCSPVFASDSARKEFASSVKNLSHYFKTDGIDLDWEYPAIEGHPGHPYLPEDKPNFTALIKTLRDSLGTELEISFAAGGFVKYLEESIDWKEVMPLVDKVNIMSYDLVGGYSTVTGHHTPLYSSPFVKESADRAIRYLDSIAVPKNKLVIGAAFYARTWENVADSNNGLFQPGHFKHSTAYFDLDRLLSRDSGYSYYYDSAARASYAYHHGKKLFATFDDSLSVALKTKYALDNGLNGIMFWELVLDKKHDGMVDLIDRVVKESKK